MFLTRGCTASKYRSKLESCSNFFSPPLMLWRLPFAQMPGKYTSWVSAFVRPKACLQYSLWNIVNSFSGNKMGFVKTRCFCSRISEHCLCFILKLKTGKHIKFNIDVLLLLFPALVHLFYSVYFHPFMKFFCPIPPCFSYRALVKHGRNQCSHKPLHY